MDMLYDRDKGEYYCLRCSFTGDEQEVLLLNAQFRAKYRDRMKRITDAKFSEPSWELSMARKDARIMIEEAERASVPLAVLPAIAARMDAVIAAGHGGDDWTVLAKDAL